LLNIHELQVFVEAAQVENFSVAAHRLLLSQPAVSLQVRNLEKELGIELFRRNGRNVSLSDAGRVLLPLAQDLIRQSKHIEEVMWGLQGLTIGELAIACSTTVGKYIIPRLIAGFRRRYPEVEVAVNVTSRRLATEWLLEGRAELAVVSTLVNHRDVALQPLIEDEVVLVVPTDHPWARASAVAPSDLLQIPLIMREPQAGSYEVLVEGLAEHGVSVADLKVVMTLGNAEAIEMSVEAGIGAAFIPRVVAARGLTLGCIAQVPVEGMTLKRAIYLARNLRRPVTPPLQAFWDFALDPANESIRQLPLS
jgi:DNA-binding transcriptional LysR family regulator